MKIRGIEISFGVHNFPYTTLGVVSLDIDVPEEITKTNWTQLECVVTVITSEGKHSDIVRMPGGAWDGHFQISQEIIAAAVAELAKRINAQRVQLMQRVAVPADNPRCYCPDCGADLGDFYNNRMRMEREVGGERP